MAQIPEQLATAKWQEVWTTKDGRSVKVADMSEEHCRNVLNLMLKRNRELTENYKASIQQQFKSCLMDEFHPKEDYAKE